MTSTEQLLSSLDDAAAKAPSIMRVGDKVGVKDIMGVKEMILLLLSCSEFAGHHGCQEHYFAASLRSGFAGQHGGLLQGALAVPGKSH